ncbi:MAG: disulfide bond formation protein B [Hyphomicrobium sp.]|jgi:disulfide bond formation protein DsbB|nr:disulfide bond formation protein B [Hyphomicrobium sp.]
MAFEVSADKGPAYTYGSAALFLTVASILTALGFEYIGGYQPCMLCLWERYAYYFAIPVLFVAIVLSAGGRKGWAAALFFLVALAFLANAGLGTYHAGAEWKYWPGPESCGGGGNLATSAGTLLQDLENIRVVRCDEPALVFLGLSFAGWNVVGSLLLMVLSLQAAFAASAQRLKG